MNRSTSNSANPVVIIGAGRSGTNMLRDVLTSRERFITWPCDEINYIWRVHNRRYPSDEIPANLASKSVLKYIRREFRKLADTASGDNSNYLVEKTCANSLRVEFVDKILPDAKYIFLVRDGRDVVASAAQRWKAPLDIPYLYAKAKYVPKVDVPFYALNYFTNRVKKLVSSEDSLSYWGPKFSNMNSIVDGLSLEEVCAWQWVKCVERSQEAFQGINDDKYITIRYEDFLSEPEQHLQKIDSFIGYDSTLEQRLEAVSSVRVKRKDEWKPKILSNEAAVDIMRPLLSKLSYPE